MILRIHILGVYEVIVKIFLIVLNMKATSLDS